jgi:hypothetical protein
MVAQMVEGQAMAAVTEGGLRPSAVAAALAAASDPEVVARPARRRLTVAYKLRVLETVAKLREQNNGAVGGYLRGEGLYYSSVKKWERLVAAGQLTTRQRGDREKSREALLVENKQLRRTVKQLMNRLTKTELAVNLRKKILGAMLESQANTERNAAG